MTFRSSYPILLADHLRLEGSIKRRSLIVNTVLTTMAAGISEGAAAATTSLRQAVAPAVHLGVHATVWTALADRASTVMADTSAAICAERTAADIYRFRTQEANQPPQDRWWRLHVERPEALNAAEDRAVLLCSAAVASRLGDLTVLWVRGVASAGGIGLYHCNGIDGDAALLLSASGVPPKLLGIALNG